MDKSVIVSAIKKAENGIEQYLEIMELFGNVNVSEHKGFQKKYNSFYRVRQRPREWYDSYYLLMEDCKTGGVSFDSVIDSIFHATGRYEPSFSSKLLATVDVQKPIWDIYVLKNTGFTPPPYYSKNKVSLAKEAYKSIEGWYKDFLSSGEGAIWIDLFNKNVGLSSQISDIKKIDFILWQIRD